MLPLKVLVVTYLLTSSQWELNFGKDEHWIDWLGLRVFGWAIWKALFVTLLHTHFLGVTAVLSSVQDRLALLGTGLVRAGHTLTSELVSAAIGHVQIVSECLEQLVNVLWIILKLVFLVTERLENIQSGTVGSISVHKLGLVWTGLVEPLKHIQVWHIVVPENLLECPVLVSEEAATAVEADLLLVEGPAILRLQFVVAYLGHKLVWQLLISVCKSALFAIATDANLDPVFAQFGLVLLFLLLVLEQVGALVIELEALALWLWLGEELGRGRELLGGDKTVTLTVGAAVKGHVELKLRQFSAILCHFLGERVLKVTFGWERIGTCAHITESLGRLSIHWEGLELRLKGVRHGWGGVVFHDPIRRFLWAIIFCSCGNAHFAGFLVGLAILFINNSRPYLLIRHSLTRGPFLCGSKGCAGMVRRVWEILGCKRVSLSWKVHCFVWNLVSVEIIVDFNF